MTERGSDNINESVHTREIRIGRLKQSELDTESQTATKNGKRLIRTPGCTGTHLYLLRKQTGFPDINCLLQSIL